jgi:hypothetical protein
MIVVLTFEPTIMGRVAGSMIGGVMRELYRFLPDKTVNPAQNAILMGEYVLARRSGLVFMVNSGLARRASDTMQALMWFMQCP